MFDEAIKSGKIETKKDYLKKLDDKLENLKERLKELTDDKEIKKAKEQIKKNKAS